MPKPQLIFKKEGNTYGEGIFYCYQVEPLLIIKLTVVKGNIYKMEVFAGSIAIKHPLAEMNKIKNGCDRDEFIKARMIVVDNMINTAKMFNV